MYIAVIKKRYDKYSNKTMPTKMITALLALILIFNNCIFNSKLHLLIKGCAIGRRCAP